METMMEVLKTFTVDRFSVLILFVTILLSSVDSGMAEKYNSTCEDEVPDCDSFHFEELCNISGKFQHYGALACRKTCGHCTDDHCIDEYDNCTDYAYEDICVKNVSWSLSHCEKFCGFCGVLGNACNPTSEHHFCQRINGASCKDGFCTCDAGFRSKIDIECEEVYMKTCNSTFKCGNLDNHVCEVPVSPTTTLAPLTNNSHCICKQGYEYNYTNHSCDAEPCSNIDKNCKACHKNNDGSDFVCTECNENFYRSNGRCLACNYWCQRNASSTTSTCRESDGFCEFGCRRGRYGYKCGRQCSSTCKDECHRDTGTCLSGCRFPGYCGPTCEITCNDGCASQTCNQSCSCLYGCNPKIWGDRCEHFCSSNCNHPQNSTGNICDVHDGSCFYGCLNNGHWGSHCTNSCSSNCVSGSCHQISGICTDGCVTNQVYGGNCSISCSPNCLNLTCARNSGFCEHGCKIGWYGETCDRQCSDHCLGKNCNQSDGTCVSGCQTGWYGKYCVQECSERCKDRMCFGNTGNCSHGCVAGFQGSHCDTVLDTPRICFGCEDMSSPQYCDTVVRCHSNETCFLESHILGHGRNFRSGCMDEKKCHFVKSVNANSVCVECCNKDMCNNIGCGNTDFLSREQRGPVCFDCHHIGTPDKCEAVTMCTSNQVCSIERYQWGDSFYYKQGCAHPVCNSLSRWRRSIPTCHSCCDTDYCNNNCTSSTNSNGEIFVG